jgi:hypothetical protein
VKIDYVKIAELVVQLGAVIIQHEDELGWGHVFARTPDGQVQPMADLHLPCGSTSCFTQTQPDGTTRHVCRDCMRDVALGKTTLDQVAAAEADASAALSAQQKGAQ